MNSKRKFKKSASGVKIVLLLIVVVLIGYLLSSLHYNHSVRIYDYTTCDGICVYNSETKISSLYVYHPYRVPTTISINDNMAWFVWIQQDDTYTKHFIEKPNIQRTLEPLTRQEMIERYENLEIVDALMTEDYMTELYIEDCQIESIDGIEFSELNLVQLNERGSHSYVFCKVIGRINWLHPYEQPPTDNYFTY